RRAPAAAELQPAGLDVDGPIVVEHRADVQRRRAGGPQEGARVVEGPGVEHRRGRTGGLRVEGAGVVEDTARDEEADVPGRPRGGSAAVDGALDALLRG